MQKIVKVCIALSVPICSSINLLYPCALATHLCGHTGLLTPGVAADTPAAESETAVLKLSAEAWTGRLQLLAVASTGPLPKSERTGAGVRPPAAVAEGTSYSGAQELPVDHSCVCRS